MNSDQTLHFVTGKGGVGKSAIAAAMALNLARNSGKTLLVELGERSFYSHIWGQEFGFDPSQVETDLFVSRWQGEDCLKEYLGHLLKVPKLADIFFENRVTKALVNSAPALKELAVVGKFTSGIRQHGPKFEYKHLVMDGYSTGHFKALLNAPVGMGQAIAFGPMGEQSREIIEVLKNPELSKFYIVTLPEELPINESFELAGFLNSDFQQRAQLILNKSLNTHFGCPELEKLVSHLEPGPETTKEYLQALLSRVKQGERLNKEQPNIQEKSWQVPHQYLPTGQELYDQIQVCLSEVKNA